MKTYFRGAVHGLPGADGVLTDGAVIAWAGSGTAPERADEEVLLEAGELLAPGFIDLQVNGFNGHDAAGRYDQVAAAWLVRRRPGHERDGFATGCRVAA